MVENSRVHFHISDFMPKNASSISRRNALGTLCQALAGSTLAGALIHQSRADDKPSEMSVTVLLNEAIGSIKPTIYSHFAEHSGGVTYDGVCVGPNSKVAN